MYIIKKDTLFIHSDGFNTNIKELNKTIDFYGNIAKKILNDSCIYYGSSLQGRIKGSKSLLNGKYKLPIIISEKNKIIFFPIKDSLKNEVYWFNFDLIKDYKRENSLVRIIFSNDESLMISVSFTIFNNQIYKCSRLWLNYLTRS